jgi:hypothetical protein
MIRWICIALPLFLTTAGCASGPVNPRKMYSEYPVKTFPPTTKIDLPVFAKHPRLVFRPTDSPGLGRTFEQSRELYKTDATFKAIFDKALKVTLGRQHPAMLATCWIVTGDDKYANAAIDHMLKHELGKSGEPYYSKLWSYALAYDWLYDHPALTAEKKKAVIDRVVERLGTELDGLDDQGMAVWHGRNQAANGVMIAALGMAEHIDKKTLRRATAHYIDALRALQYSEAWPEGASYWIYNRAGPYPMAADCVITATGLDTLDGIPIREVMRKIGLWEVYQYTPYKFFEPHGDSSGSLRLGKTGWWELSCDHYAKLSRDPVLMAGADYLRNSSPIPYGGPGKQRPYYWHVAFTYDPTIRPKKSYDPKKPELWMRKNWPQSMLFGRDSWGVAFFRGNWGDPNEIYASFKAGDLMAHHDHYDVGHFSIQANGGIVAPQTGLYSVGYWSDHRLGYALQTVSANSLLILAPGETSYDLRRRKSAGTPAWKWMSGGQRIIRATGFHCVSVAHFLQQRNNGPHFERATITAFDSKPGVYDYVAADITAAYNSTVWAEPGSVAKVSKVTRQFVYLRKEKAFVVYDRVETTKKEYLSKFLLHHLSKPRSPNEKLLAGKERRNGIIETADRVLVSTHKTGKLTHHVLLPEKARVLKIGGPGYSCYVEKDGDQSNGFDGVNLGAGRKRYDYDSKDAQLGRWRTEVGPAASGTSTRFLNVLDVDAKRTKPLTVAMVDAGPGAHAAQVGDTIVVFAREPKPLKQVDLAPSKAGTCIVLDAPAGARCSAGRQRPTASKEGVLTIERTGVGPLRIRVR